MMKRFTAWILALSVAISCQVVGVPEASANKLQKLREETKKSHKSSRSTDNDDQYDGNRYDDDDDGDGILAFYAFTAPWWLPHMAVGDEFGRHFGYPVRPYADGRDGYIQFTDEKRPPMAGGSGGLRNGAVRLKFEAARIDQSLIRRGIAARFSGNHRFEIETAWSQYTEAVTSGLLDQLLIGDVNARVQYAVHPNISFHSGIGVRTMLDKSENTYGFNFNYGVDVFPADPVILSADFDLGNLGSAPVMHLRATAGVLVGPVELYGGWDAIWVGSVELGGWTGGVRAWL